MIKGGEWRLGVDEEPKTFQIIRVKTISFEPRFKPGSPDHDIAILHLEDQLRFDTHIQPICIEDPLWPAEEKDEECITTGWGHEILKGKIKYKMIVVNEEINIVYFLIEFQFMYKMHLCMLLI